MGGGDSENSASGEMRTFQRYSVSSLNLAEKLLGFSYFGPVVLFAQYVEEATLSHCT